MKITVETLVRADRGTVWECWTTPEDIVRWNAASDDWHTTRSVVDLREGGSFLSRMDDGREVTVRFLQRPEGVVVRTTFDAEGEHSPEMQRAGWQAISDNFGRYVESKPSG